MSNAVNISRQKRITHFCWHSNMSPFFGNTKMSRWMSLCWPNISCQKWIHPRMSLAHTRVISIQLLKHFPFWSQVLWPNPIASLSEAIAKKRNLPRTSTSLLQPVSIDTSSYNDDNCLDWQITLTLRNCRAVKPNTFLNVQNTTKITTKSSRESVSVNWRITFNRASPNHDLQILSFSSTHLSIFQPKQQHFFHESETSLFRIVILLLLFVWFLLLILLCYRCGRRHIPALYQTVRSTAVRHNWPANVDQYHRRLGKSPTFQSEISHKNGRSSCLRDVTQTKVLFLHLLCSHQKQKDWMNFCKSTVPENFVFCSFHMVQKRNLLLDRVPENDSPQPSRSEDEIWCQQTTNLTKKLKHFVEERLTDVQKNIFFWCQVLNVILRVSIKICPPIIRFQNLHCARCCLATALTAIEVGHKLETGRIIFSFWQISLFWNHQGLSGKSKNKSVNKVRHEVKLIRLIKEISTGLEADPQCGPRRPSRRLLDLDLESRSGLRVSCTQHQD